MPAPTQSEALALCKIIQSSSRPRILARPPLVKISVSPVFSEITVLALHSASQPVAWQSCSMSSCAAVVIDQRILRNLHVCACRQ